MKTNISLVTLLLFAAALCPSCGGDALAQGSAPAVEVETSMLEETQSPEEGDEDEVSFDADDLSDEMD